MVGLGRDSMGLFIVRFLVRPKDTFLLRLQGSNSDFAFILRDSTLWSQAFGHRTTIDLNECRDVVKRLHIALLLEFSGNEEFDSLVGQLTVSVACFDEFWELIHVDGEESVDHALQQLPEELRDKVSGG